MIFFAKFSGTFAHFSYKLPSWVSFCPDGVSFCPEYHHQPLFFTQPSQTPFEDTYKDKTPPTLPKNTTFPELKLKVSKMNYSLGKMDPYWAKCLEVGKKKIHLNMAKQPQELDLLRNPSIDSFIMLRNL